MARRPLVDAGWLAERIAGGDSVRLVHVAPDRSVYDLRHLPGAVYGDLHGVLALRGTVPETGTVEREWLTPGRNHMAEALAGWGIGEGDRVVFYDDVGQNRQAIRGYWLLRLYGFDPERVHVLDGGLTAWEAEGGEVTDIERHPPAPVRRAELGPADPSLVATAAEVLEWSREIGDGGPPRLLDVRTIDEYLGRDVRARRGGRIPGARHRLWQDLVGLDNRLRPVPDAVAAVRASGVDPAELRAVYCQGAVRAALVWFVLHELGGYEGVKSYAGSWEEWGNRLELPVEQ